MKFKHAGVLAALIALVVCGIVRADAASRYFEIDVVDDTTGRGVPLVELRTVDNVRYTTDSAGIVAIDDPELIGQKVYFFVKSPGYSFPVDGFGYAGVALPVIPGKRAVIRIHRENIAERLYRITGAGIYRDSVLVGRHAPISHPLLDAQVFGQDSVMATPYRGKLFWFWGDTNRPSYPLGQFATSGATSLLPGHGGLDPSQGVNLAYWVDKDGFSRPMIPIKGATGPVWIGGLFTLTENGHEQLYTHYNVVNRAMTPTQSGLAEFDNSQGAFKSIHKYDVADTLVPNGHPFLVDEDGTRYLYFGTVAMGAFPLVRCPANIDDLVDSSKYESFTCLAAGTRFDGIRTRLQRDSSGRLDWSWKKNTAPLGEDQANFLVEKRLMRPDELQTSLRDIDTDAVVLSHSGSVFWNSYRHRWIMITTQVYGKPSFLGEVWFAEADTPVGPWLYAKRIATHDHYSFYNPTQDPFFDQRDDRIIYFEGTYSATFSDVKDITPRYDYNQLMYRLDLGDKRLALPSPVYRLDTKSGYRYGQREQLAGDRANWSRIDTIPFYAMPRTANHAGLVPVFEDDAGGDALLSTQGHAGASPLFYALPAQPAPGEKVSPAVVSLYEYEDRKSGRRWYATDASRDPSAARSATPLCRVWRNPSTNLTFDFGALPAGPR